MERHGEKREKKWTLSSVSHPNEGPNSKRPQGLAPCRGVPCRLDDISLKDVNSEWDVQDRVTESRLVPVTGLFVGNGTRDRRVLPCSSTEGPRRFLLVQVVL